MSIASEITRLQNAKVNLRSTLADVYGTSIPESALVDTWPQYLVPAGCYATPPQANGVYIKYVGNCYSDYNVLWSGKTPVGVGLKTSACSFCIHPTYRTSAIKWCNSLVLISGVTTTLDHSEAHADFSGKSNTQAVLTSGYTSPAFNVVNQSFADGSFGWVPSVGELDTIKSNVTTVNYALGLIGGTAFNFSATSNSYRIWTSTQANASVAWTWDAPVQDFGGIQKNQTYPFSFPVSDFITSNTL